MVEEKACLHIGSKFGTVSKQAVMEAIKACRDKLDGDWLLIPGFFFEGGITELSRRSGNQRRYICFSSSATAVTIRLCTCALSG